MNQKKLHISRVRYRLPDVTYSIQEFARLHHKDLPGMNDFVLTQELYKTKEELMNIDVNNQPWLFVAPGISVSAFDWLSERLSRVQAEDRKRRSAFTQIRKFVSSL